MEPDYHGQLESLPEGTGLPQTNTLSHTSKSGASAGAITLGDRNWASGHRTPSAGKEGSSAMKSSRVRAGSENLTTVDS